MRTENELIIMRVDHRESDLEDHDRGQDYDLPRLLERRGLTFTCAVQFGLFARASRSNPTLSSLVAKRKSVVSLIVPPCVGARLPTLAN
jgi:hypothetical protein